MILGGIKGNKLTVNYFCKENFIVDVWQGYKYALDIGEMYF